MIPMVYFQGNEVDLYLMVIKKIIPKEDLA